MTITQTVEIPADRWVFFDVPREVPMGKMRVDVILTPVVEKPKDQRSPDRKTPVRKAKTAPKKAGKEASPHPNSDALFAPIRGTVDIDEIRLERIMSKHCKHLK